MADTGKNTDPLPPKAGQARAYQHKDLFVAINLAAILGWLVLSAPLIFATPEIVPIAMVVGLPIAFVVCWFFLSPVLWHIMKKPLSWTRSAVWGGLISSTMALIVISFTRYLGWREFKDPNSFSRFDGRDGTIELDGILTPLGWGLLLRDTFIFVSAGVLVALVIRWVVGPGRR